MIELKERTENNSSQGRLTLQVVDIAPQTTAMRCLDWDRDRFDIEFGLNKPDRKKNNICFIFQLTIKNKAAFLKEKGF